MTPTAALIQARPDAPALEAIDVVKLYEGNAVLDHVSLRVERGEFVTLVGESGAGKTTLLRTFNRTVEPDGGRVCVGGQDVRGINPVRIRRAMGYVQQEGGLLPHWDVLRNVALVPWLMKRSEASRMAAKSLMRVGLPPEEFGSRMPTELSGGQRQRVALARALAANPQTVLLDEPFRALDAITRSELVEMVRAVLKELHVTVLIVTHDLRNALKISDRVAVLRSGRVEQCSTPDDLCSGQSSPYVTELLHRAGVETS
jgi:osmoprotectant transport system ATP-binding protein